MKAIIINKIHYLIATVGLLACIIVFNACKEDAVNSEIQNLIEITSTVERLNFANDADLLSAINNKDYDLQSKAQKGFRGLLKPVAGGLRSDNIDYSDPYYELGFDTLIPNREFAKLFNTDGEIEVGNYIVKVTEKGTYKYLFEKEKDFEQIFALDPKSGQQTEEEDVYLLEQGVFFYDTFKEDVAEFQLPLEDEEQQSVLRASIPEPNYDSFETFSANRQTVVGKFFQNIIGAKINHTIVYASNNNRRLRGSFYDYNYGVYKEIGVQGWTDKKNWIGWSKTPSDELRVGWRNVWIEAELNDVMKAAIQNAKSLQNLYTTPKYYYLPGSNKPVYASIAVLPTVSLSTIEKYRNQGAVALYKFLKSKLQQPSEFDKLQAAIVYTNTHVVVAITDNTIIKNNAEEYTHFFAEQFKIQISVSTNDFKNFTSSDSKVQQSALISTIVNTIKESFSLPSFTMKSGEVFVCAYFNPEWKGMKIKK
jgi:hypothetical protein